MLYNYITVFSEEFLQMKIANPEMKVVRFENEDVIATSMFIIADADSLTGISGFYGAMHGPVEEGTWIIGNDGYKFDVSEEELELIKDGEYGYTFYGEPVYDAYQTEEYGPYYTKGASYWDMYGNQ